MQTHRHGSLQPDEHTFLNRFFSSRRPFPRSCGSPPVRPNRPGFDPHIAVRRLHKDAQIHPSSSTPQHRGEFVALNQSSSRAFRSPPPSSTISRIGSFFARAVLLALAVLHSVPPYRLNVLVPHTFEFKPLRVQEFTFPPRLRPCDCFSPSCTCTDGS